MKTDCRCIAVLLLGLLVSAPAHSQSNEALQRTADHMIEVSYAGDREALLAARQSLEPFTKDEAAAALAHYYLGLADWWTSPLATDRDEMTTLMDSAIDHFKTATELQDDLGDAYALHVMSFFPLYRLDPSRAQTMMAQTDSLLNKALAVAPKSPLVLLTQGMNLFFMPPQFGGDQEQGSALMEEALQQYDHLDPNATAAWSQATAYSLIGQSYMYKNPPAPQKARYAYEKALALRPDFRTVKRTLLPQTELLSARSPEMFSQVTWTPLANDDEGDANNANLADGKALSYYYDATADSLWFKIDLHSLPNTETIGINLVVDTDQDQSTGASWWGSNRSFTFDKLVTAWVVKAQPGKYAGTMGIGDAASVMRFQMTNLSQNNISLSVDEPGKTLIIGLKRTDLDEDHAMNLIAAVGSNMAWNDDLQDTDYTRLNLSKTP